MDVKKNLILEYFLSLSPSGDAIVVDKDDILQMLSQNKQVLGIKELDLVLDNLKDTEYISVKYKDETMICLTPLTKARIAVRQGKEGIEELKKLSKTLKVDINYKKILLLSLLGGFVGSLLAYGLAELVKILVGN